MRVSIWKLIVRMFVVLVFLVPAQVSAQEFPTKPIRIIVSFPAGSGIDASTRLIAAKLTPLLGQTVFVENRPGASGAIGAEAAAKAPPDGYTLFNMPVTTLMVEYLHSNLPYNVARDFVAVSLIGVSQTGILANPSLPAKDVKELITLSKKDPLNVATVGVGSNHHLYGEWFAALTGAKLNFIAYNTSAPLNDLVAGQTQVMFDALSAAVGLVQGGKLKLLAITGKSRHPSFPDVPTFAESNLGEYEPLAWGGLLAPTGTPDAIVTRLGAAAATAAKSPDVVARYRRAGGEAVGSTPAEFAAFIKSEQAKWSRVIKAANIQLK